MDLNQVVVFTEVAKTGSFTRAAKALEMPKSTVSRKVSDLEERLGVRLIQRTTRTLSLTNEGLRYYEHCLRVVSELEEAESALGEMGAEPRGLLRITAPLSFGSLGQVLAEYRAKFPLVQIELVCTDRVVDLVDERFDLAIRAGKLSDSTLIARPLGHLPSLLIASPAYLSRKGVPKLPSDLAQHDCLAFSPRGKATWNLVSGDKTEKVSIKSAFAANDFDILREAVISGAGISLQARTTSFLDLKEGRLRRVLPDWSGEPTPLHAVYPSTRHLSSRVRAFTDLVQAYFTKLAKSDP